MFRISGHRKTIDGTDLIVWVKLDSERDVSFKIATNENQ